jgi:AcrR family transcriptional regulator
MKTRQIIIEATERIIQSKGLARTTTKEIAREAGCAEGTLYKHFEDKESLFLTVIQENLPDFAQIMHADRAGTGTVAENLEEIALAAIQYYEKLLPLAISVFADADLLARQRTWMQEQQRSPIRIYERVATYVEAEQRIGRIDEQIAPLSLAALLLGPCFQYAFNRYFMGQDPFPQQTEQQFVHNFVQTLL